MGEKYVLERVLSRRSVVRGLGLGLVAAPLVHLIGCGTESSSDVDVTDATDAGSSADAGAIADAGSKADAGAVADAGGA